MVSSAIPYVVPPMAQIHMIIGIMIFSRPSNRLTTFESAASIAFVSNSTPRQPPKTSTKSTTSIAPLKPSMGAFTMSHNPFITTTKDAEFEQLITDLQQMQEHLEKEAAIRQSTLQYISHEMKTPLMIIEGYTTSAKDSIYPKGDLESSFDTILVQTERMKQKVADLLTIVRLEASSVPDDTTEICLLSAIQHILQLFEQKKQNHMYSYCKKYFFDWQ